MSYAPDPHERASYTAAANRDHWWVGTYVCMSAHAHYHTAHDGGPYSVQLWRYIENTDKTVSVVRRYVPREKIMRLLRIDHMEGMGK